MSVTESSDTPRRCRILLMDDEPLVRDAIAMLLRSMQYEVLVAANGAEALRLVATHQIDPEDRLIALLDLTILNGLGGRDVLEPLKALVPAARAVVMSGRQDDPLVTNYAEHGFDAVLSKPFQLKELSDLLTRLSNGL